MIELPIYEKSGKKSLLIYTGIGILVVLTLLLLFPNSSPLLFIIPLSIFIIIISVIEREGKRLGTIYLTERQILIKTENIDLKSELTRIRKLKLKYSGYKGKRLPADFFPRFNQFSGMDNFISIDLGTDVYKFYFLVEDEIKEKQLFDLVSEWEKEGFDVSSVALNI